MYMGEYVQLEEEVRNGMCQLASFNINDKYIHLGCGEGQFLEYALTLGVKPQNVWGVEWDTDLYNVCLGKGLNVINDDCFNLDYSDYDIVTFWFTLNDNLTQLLDKLYNELPNKAKVICIHSSRQQWRDGVYVPEESYPIINHVWQPDSSIDVLGNRIWVYER